MNKKIVTLICSAVIAISVCGAKQAQPTPKPTPTPKTSPAAKTNREIVLGNDNTNPDRNRLLKEDIEFFASRLAKNHINPFGSLSEERFKSMTSTLAENVSKLNNNEVFNGLNMITAAIGDAHTTINSWDGKSYPVKFWIFGKTRDVYVIDCDKSLEDILYARVVNVNGVNIDEVLDRLSLLVSRENESWLQYMLAAYLSQPVYLFRQGVIPSSSEAVFTIEKNGLVSNISIPVLSFGQKADMLVNKTRDPFTGVFEKYYDYKYLDDYKSLYFEYNACADMKDLSFKDFNKEMFKSIESRDIQKIVIDLRSNSGGNSEIIKPFTQKLKNYLKSNPNTKVYTLISRKTFSSGIFAIFYIREAAPNAVTVGELTGGAIDSYGEVKTFELPNSKVPVSYSTKRFDLNKDFNYKNAVTTTFIPNFKVEYTIDDYIKGNDVVLKYSLEN